jgi:hypothetical protein
MRIPLIFNVPYMPKYNGIEKIWAIYKKVFRKRMLELKIKEKECWN